LILFVKENPAILRQPHRAAKRGFAHEIASDDGAWRRDVLRVHNGGGAAANRCSGNSGRYQSRNAGQHLADRHADG
jgi:hypothetical protein